MLKTLVCPGPIEGITVVTFTAPWSLRDVEPRMPSAAYLRYLAGGLSESGPWEDRDIADYLSACPGAPGTRRWSNCRSCSPTGPPVTRKAQVGTLGLRTAPMRRG